ncbi:MAG: thioredoxin family protein [Comamonas sp.]
MSYSAQHLAQEPTRASVEQRGGLAVLEFGTPWCPHCTGAQPLIEQALAGRADIAHFKVEDGPGKPLGRSYRVKLWPTLIALRDGQEVARVVRPTSPATLTELLAALN